MMSVAVVIGGRSSVVMIGGCGCSHDRGVWLWS